jgi:hypothetical protein
MGKLNILNHNWFILHDKLKNRGKRMLKLAISARLFTSDFTMFVHPISRALPTVT